VVAWDTEATRRRLLDAATAEFAERGREGTTMTSIAGRAGLNKERLYSYFGDKDSLWELVLTGELERLATAVELGGAGLDDIGDFAGATFDYHAEHPQLRRRLWPAGRPTTATRSSGSPRPSTTGCSMTASTRHTWCSPSSRWPPGGRRSPSSLR
jgi:AcrR family transcriptional regulator